MGMQEHQEEVMLKLLQTTQTHEHDRIDLVIQLPAFMEGAFVSSELRRPKEYIYIIIRTFSHVLFL